MGFVTGFTGGVTLTLGAAYLAIAAHERNRQAQADVLRAQTRVVNALAQDPAERRPRLDTAPLPSRAELAAQHRTDFVEAAKDKWNSEIENAVRWAQTRNWTGVREEAEDATARLLGLAKEGEREAARRAEQIGHSFAEDARAAKEEARSRLIHTREQVAEKAVEAKEEAKGVLANAIEKGKHMYGRAKAAVHLAEERAEAKVDAKLLHLSDVEKALNERFEKPKEDPMSKSIEEILNERYIPIDKRDNTRLRGL